MKRGLFLSVTLGLLLAVMPAFSQALAANKVLAIGDSWGYAIPDPLNGHFNTNGHGDWDVLNLAVPGGSADAYASDMAGVLTLTLNTLAASPGIEVVLISLGGNDFWPNYMSQGSPVFTAIENDLRYIVAQILNVRPDVDIVFTGYDVLKYDKSDICLLFALTYYGVIFPWEVTPLFMEIGAAQYRIATDYPEVTYLNLFGTGQGNPGSPDLLQWSPSSYVASEDADCLHLSGSGYNTFSKEIYCQYFAPRFGETCNPFKCSIGSPHGGTFSLPSMLSVLVYLFAAPFAAVWYWKRRYAVGNLGTRN